MKKYVIVGANQSSIYSDGFTALPGAKVTALAWKFFLDKQGFEEVAFLTDEDATRTKVLCGLTNLFSDLKSNDFALFIYMGHGRQIENKNNSPLFPFDEGDGKDEELICKGDPILDDEIRLLLNLNKKKAPVFIIIDACDNGLIEGESLSANKFVNDNEVAFSSTAKTDKAYMESFDEEKQQKKEEAVYSTFLLDVVKANLGKNYNEIFDLAREKIEKDGYPQNPQMAFTNGTILKNPIFSSPLKMDLSFSRKDIELLLADPNKGIGGLMSETQAERIVKFIRKDIFKINKRI